jgi:large subunit ribosomal protein L18
MSVVQDKHERRMRRKRGIRKKVIGTAERPRLSVFRSHKNIGAQIVDDSRGVTICAVSSLNKDVRSALAYGGNKEAAKRIGEILAERAVAKGVSDVVFDRNGYKFHGRVLSLADAAREGGLKF